MGWLQVLTQARAEGCAPPGADPAAAARWRPHPRLTARRRLPAKPSISTNSRHAFGTRAARRCDAGEAAASEFGGCAAIPPAGGLFPRRGDELAPREAALLRALLARPGARSRRAVVEAVFPGETVQAEAIEVVNLPVRKKLAATGVQLVTLRGLGLLPEGAGVMTTPRRRYTSGPRGERARC